MEVTRGEEEGCYVDALSGGEGTTLNHHVYQADSVDELLEERRDEKIFDTHPARERMVGVLTHVFGHLEDLACEEDGIHQEDFYAGDEDSEVYLQAEPSQD